MLISRERQGDSESQCVCWTCHSHLISKKLCGLFTLFPFNRCWGNSLGFVIITINGSSYIWTELCTLKWMPFWLLLIWKESEHCVRVILCYRIVITCKIWKLFRNISKPIMFSKESGIWTASVKQAFNYFLEYYIAAFCLQLHILLN